MSYLKYFGKYNNNKYYFVIIINVCDHTEEWSVFSSLFAILIVLVKIECGLVM